MDRDAQETMRVAVVGARRRRQGTGEYVARELARLGCEVAAVVGTSPETTAAACEGLRARHGIVAAGYQSLARLLEREPLDAVAVCSPPEAHLEQVEAALAAGCHVLCEKPLWWGPDLVGAGALDAAAVAAQADALLARSAASGRYLALNTQWPHTLEAFRRLHPDALGPDRSIESFTMWLSPTSAGARMLVDSGSHLISMLQALAGPGSLFGVEAEYAGPRRSSLLLRCGYRHAGGETRVELRLSRCPDPPRPAGYAINGRSVERRVELATYAISFASAGRSVPARDPLAASVEEFVRACRAGGRPDRASVVDGMTLLQELVRAAEGREVR